MSPQSQVAPDWEIERWFNTPRPVDLASLRGRVVVAGAFQMLCPGCVSHLLPQLAQVHRIFPNKHVQVIGLHTVFEHHAAMRPVSLEAFLHEYRVAYPVGVDRATGPDDPLPITMQRYRMQGTPTLLLIDRAGRLRRQVFGHLPDLQLGAEIAALIGEPPETSLVADPNGAEKDGCSETACSPR